MNEQTKRKIELLLKKIDEEAGALDEFLAREIEELERTAVDKSQRQAVREMKRELRGER